MELDLLKTATRILEDALGREVLAYRAPGFRLSYRTLSLLAHLGYKADLSVTPQRFSLIQLVPLGVRMDDCSAFALFPEPLLPISARRRSSHGDPGKFTDFPVGARRHRKSR